MYLRTGLLLILLICYSGCAHDTELRRQQSEASRNLGEAYMAQGDYTTALRELLQAEKVYADDPFLQNSLGLAYLGRGRPELALVHFDKALRLNPEYAPAMNNKGAAYLAQGDWDAAITSLTSITGDLLYATPHFPLANLGWAYFNKGDYAQAQKYYLEALKLEPNFLMATHGLARTYLAQNQAAEAVKILERALRDHPNQAELHLDIGRAYTLQRRYDPAASAFQRAMELAPDSELAQNAAERLRALPR